MKNHKAKEATDVKKNTLPPFEMPDETAFDMVNRYGTYEIQPTADTENQYPAIAQGFNEKIIKRDCQRLSHGEEW